MKTQRTFTESGPPPITATRASQLCGLRAELDEERLELDRASRAIENEIKRIEIQLLRFAKSSDPPVVNVSRWQIAVVEKNGFFSYKDNLISELGFEEFERRRLSVPKEDDLQVTELRPAAPTKAVKEARAKAASLRTKRTTAASKKRAA